MKDFKINDSNSNNNMNEEIMFNENEEIDFTEKKKSKKKYTNEIIEEEKLEIENKNKNNNGKYSELWKTGEQLWREDNFDFEYLRQNPDGITRIFCGNLNKNITEEQLRSCIENIGKK